MTIRVVRLRSGRGSGPITFARSDPNPEAPVLALPGIESFGSFETSTSVAGLILGRVPAGRSPLPGASFPIVGGCDLDLFTAGETVEVDGDLGAVDIPGVVDVPVVTSFLVRPDGRVLLLKRSEKVGSFRGRWAGVSGFLEEGTARGQAVKEIREETGIPESALTFLAEGPPVYSRDRARLFVVHPFAFRVRSDHVRLDWEHTEFEWVEPSEIGRRPAVPKLDRVWAELEASVRSATGPAGGPAKV